MCNVSDVCNVSDAPNVADANPSVVDQRLLSEDAVVPNVQPDVRPVVQDDEGVRRGLRVRREPNEPPVTVVLIRVLLSNPERSLPNGPD